MRIVSCFFFFNDTATTEIYTLSLHDALPICQRRRHEKQLVDAAAVHVDDFDLPPVDVEAFAFGGDPGQLFERSEEHTSELHSRQYLACRLLLEKKTQSTHKKQTRTLLNATLL